MGEAGDKIKAGLEEAVAFAKGVCSHDWEDAGSSMTGKVVRCKKCGVRLNTMSKVFDDDQD